jgi:hypothetical protein
VAGDKSFRREEMKRGDLQLEEETQARNPATKHFLFFFLPWAIPLASLGDEHEKNRDQPGESLTRRLLRSLWLKTAAGRAKEGGKKRKTSHSTTLRSDSFMSQYSYTDHPF